MIVCADDYGLAPDIDEAIVELAARRQIDAVSVIVASPWCNEQAVAALKAVADRVSLGLHLLLIDGIPLAPEDELSHLVTATGFLPHFGKLLRRAACGQLRSAEVQKEIAAQYDAFVRLFGMPPRFIDSHLHTHQFPTLAEGLAAFVLGLDAARRPYVRNTHVPIAKAIRQGVSVWKNLFISLYGRRNRRLLDHLGIPTNSGFAGIYDYRQHNRYPDYHQRMTAHMETSSGILMVHPGKKEPWRRSEYEVLRSTTPKAAADSGR